VIGACFPGDVERIRSFVSASTRITHTDPKAEQGALAVALGAGYAAETKPGTLNPQEVLDFLREHLKDEELLSQAGENPRNGISGYMYHTVPAALSSWLRHPHDFRAAVSDVIRLGGDADTTGSIVGALAGATLGASAIPKEWLDRLWEWPRTVGWMRRLAHRLRRQFPAEGEPERVGPAGLFWPALPLRNLVFLAAVLVHGFRRLLPPY
jgi:ADP-ribosylglycohydrolase